MGVVLAGLFLGGLLAALGWLQVKHARERERLAELIESTRTTRVKDLDRPGLVEVEGQARSRDEGAVLPRAPVSGVRCLYWRFVVEEEVKRTTGYGKNRRTKRVWVTRLNRSEAVPFVLDDGSGGVELDTDGADGGLRTDASGRSGFLRDPSPEVAAALSRFGFSSTGLVLNKTLRWSETFLSPGDRLYALGTFDGRRITRGSDDVLIVADRPQHEVHASYVDAARRARRSALVCQAMGGLAALLGVAFGLIQLTR